MKIFNRFRNNKEKEICKSCQGYTDGSKETFELFITRFVRELYVTKEDAITVPEEFREELMQYLSERPSIGDVVDHAFDTSAAWRTPGFVLTKKENTSRFVDEVSDGKVFIVISVIESDDFIKFLSKTENHKIRKKVLGEYSSCLCPAGNRMYLSRIGQIGDHSHYNTMPGSNGVLLRQLNEFSEKKGDENE